MKNSFEIKDICNQLGKACEQIISLSTGIEQFDSAKQVELIGTYEELMLVELEIVQRLTLSLTELITEETSVSALEKNDEGVGSVFAENELRYVKDGSEAEYTTKQ